MRKSKFLIMMAVLLSTASCTKSGEISEDLVTIKAESGDVINKNRKLVKVNKGKKGLYLGYNMYRSYYGNSVSDDIDDMAGHNKSYKFGGFLGDHVRTELEITDFKHAESRIGSDKAVTAAMWNGYYDFSEPETSVNPYLGAGLGLASLEDSTLSADKSYLAWQVSTGLEYRVLPQTSLDIGYRYFRTGEVKFDTSLSDDDKNTYKTHNFGVGVKLGF